MTTTERQRRRRIRGNGFCARSVIERLRWYVVGLSIVACGLAGCGDQPAPPPTVSAELRQAVKQNLSKLGAKVTADDVDGLYASLRNTHVRVLPTGGIVEGAPRAGQDRQDFKTVNEAIARELLSSGEFPAFQQWLTAVFTTGGTNTHRKEYSGYQLSMSRTPLRVVFSHRPPPSE